MANVPEYDGYLEVENDQIRESFIQLNENIRALQERLNTAEANIAANQVNISNLEVTKQDA
tara:strand:- start:267 stop:449 length:183 start_codon:yes stop_codon:yes gene_type:complete